MPLKCARSGSPLFAFDVESEAAWEQLRHENRADNSLKLLCCDVDVTLRTSKLGTRHFAHRRRGPCSTAPETAEHLLAKRLIVEGIRRAGWIALPEQSGESPNYGSWIADVMAQNGAAKVAFEVQWSKQDEAETRRRQQRYKDSQMRGLWFLRQTDIPLEKATPAFRVVFDEMTSQVSVLLPSPRYANWLGSRERSESRYWNEPVELSRFVHGALTGKLTFAPALGKLLPVEVYTAPTDCWRCKKETRLIISVVFAAGRSFPGSSDISLDIYDFQDLPDGPNILAAMLPAPLLKKHGIGVVKPRYSKTQGGSYLSNGCAYCDALQGRFFDHEVAFEAEKSFEVSCTFEPEWAHLLDDASNSANRWWFDAGVWDEDPKT